MSDNSKEPLLLFNEVVTQTKDEPMNRQQEFGLKE